MRLGVHLGLLAAVFFVAGACEPDAGGLVAAKAPVPAVATRDARGGRDAAADASPVSVAATPDAGVDAGAVGTDEPEIWSADRSLYVTVVDFRVHVWDGRTRAAVAELDDTMCEDPVFSPDGKTLYVGHENRPPAAFDAATKFAKPRSFELPKGISPNADAGVAKLSVSTDGRWLVGRCNTASVCLWSTKTLTGRTWAPPSGPAFADVKTIAFTDQDAHVTMTMEDGATFVLEVPSLKRVR